MATSAEDLLKYGNVSQNYLTEYFVGDSNMGLTAPEKLFYIADGIESAEPKQDDKKSSKAYFNGGGQETTTITGSTRSVDFSGDRAIGDPAQDLIAGLADTTGSARNKWFRENEYIIGDNGKLQLVSSRTGIVTWSDITDKGGNASDPGSFKATATYTSKPQTLKTPADATKLATVLTETPSVNSKILGLEAEVQGATTPGK